MNIVIPFDLGANPWAVEARDVVGDGRAELGPCAGPCV